MKRILLTLWLGLTGCVGVPEGLTVVENFDAARYMGRWYEIVRLDHSFERGLSQVYAEYTANPDGSIKVVNHGFNAAKNRWQQAEGLAKFVGQRNRGELKVSFFGPFYGAYNIIELDPDYQWSLVAGPDRSYLWLLSRSPSLPEATRTRLIQQARDWGFATDKLLDGQTGHPMQSGPY